MTAAIAYSAQAVRPRAGRARPGPHQGAPVTVILGFLGIWENGDFSFNYYPSPVESREYSPLVSQGVFNPKKDAAIRDWPQRLGAL